MRICSRFSWLAAIIRSPVNGLLGKQIPLRHDDVEVDPPSFSLKIL